LAAIEIIRRDGLPERAMTLGQRMKERFCALMAKSPILGDVRGNGLVWGLELVHDKTTKQPAPDLAKAVVEAACRPGLLMIAPIRFYGNVLRIAPPLVIEEAHLDKALDILEETILHL